MRDVEAVGEALQRTADMLSSSINAVFADLEGVAAAVTAAAEAVPGVPRRSDFLFLRNELATFINAHSDLIIGAGIAYAPGSLPEAPHWLEWWRAQPKAEPRFVTHDLNPDSLNYYDYTGREWFTLPSSTGQPVAVGPYVDFGGINVSIITLCVPAQTAQGIHVLGCDLPLAKLEGVFLRALQLRDPAVVLLGPNGRVIASNNARIATGTLLLDEDLKRAETSLDVSQGSPTRLPWKLISLT
ncbi:cache domain-containing protein [Arthrobacter sp. B10-11]|uniref:cache domain-containing protein n=1 Tax=Arthrobacter sp. B10-11 TaxID=3081160 RepID=UPI0029537261|nr:cache domain-containing protein [Arthrobacter sp. B10-11]MDV8149014.1 cache domain-containing protein [Arthrobacter sp. B10-11]